LGKAEGALFGDAATRSKLTSGVECLCGAYFSRRANISNSYGRMVIVFVRAERRDVMGKRARSGTALFMDSVVTVLGVAGFLGFLAAARMDDANASPFDAMAYAWFFGFLVLKMCLPWFRSRRAPSRREQYGLDPMNVVGSERRWHSN
jgi:hypothetical protein